MTPPKSASITNDTSMNNRFSSLAHMGAWLSLLAFPMLSPAASVIYSNFGAGSSYNTSQANPVGNAFDGSVYAEGDTFLLAGDATFTSLRIALSCFAFCTDPFFITVSRDAGNQPGTALETFVVSPGVLGTLGANNSPLVLTSLLNPIFTAGTRYWITARAGLNDSIGWNLNSTGDPSAEALSTDGGATWFSPSGNTPGAFELSGIVPEPASIGLVLCAALLLYAVLGFIGKSRMAG
jgi:hypothetical protein